MSVEALPWAMAGAGADPAEALMIAPMSKGASGFEVSDSASFEFGASVAERLTLPGVPGSPVTAHEWDAPRVFVGLHMPLEVLIANLQGLLTSQDFAWFHPDDLTLIARRGLDMLHAVARVERLGEAVLSLTVSFSPASPESVQAVADSIAWMVAQLEAP